MLERFAEVVSQAHRRLTDLQLLAMREHQLRQAQKLEALGRLTGGVAHDFRNLLTAVEGYSQLLLRDLPAGSPARTYAEEILRAGQRAGQLTRQLLAYSRRQQLAPAPLELAMVVSGLEAMLRMLLGASRELVVTGPGQPAWILADRGQLEQVLVNLVTNARDAIVEHGRVEVRIEAVRLDATGAALYGAAMPGNYVRLRVSDDGAGMDEEALEHLFEPFFTTKEVGQGTGLGLATVYGIVTQHRGFIRVTSSPGEGTAFEILLPALAEPPAGPAAGAEPASAGG